MKKIKKSKFLAVLLATGMSISGLGGNTFACKNGKNVQLCPTALRNLRHKCSLYFASCFKENRGMESMDGFNNHVNRIESFSLDKFKENLPEYVKPILKNWGKDICNNGKLTEKEKTLSIYVILVSASMNYNFLTSEPEQSQSVSKGPYKRLRSKQSQSVSKEPYKSLMSIIEDCLSFQQSDKVSNDICKQLVDISYGGMPFSEDYINKKNICEWEQDFLKVSETAQYQTLPPDRNPQGNSTPALISRSATRDAIAISNGHYHDSITPNSLNDPKLVGENRQIFETLLDVRTFLREDYRKLIEKVKR